MAWLDNLADSGPLDELVSITHRTIDATEGDAANLPATDLETNAIAQNSLDEIADMPQF